MKRFAFAAAIYAALFSSAQAQTIVDEWASVKAPPPVELKKVTVDPSTTAFLVLDLLNANGSEQRRPRCVASVPKVTKFLGEARNRKMTVVHSITVTTKVEDLDPRVAPQAGEPVVQTVANKFIRTDLDKILKERGIKTVIVSGTAAQGAVLFTASEAAFLGYKVIVPVEGSTSELLYGEQAVAWLLANAPGVGANTTLTSFDMIGF